VILRPAPQLLKTKSGLCLCFAMLDRASYRRKEINFEQGFHF